MISFILAALLQTHPPYVPRHNVDRPGEVFDTRLCVAAADLENVEAAVCPRVDSVPVWVEDLDDNGRARVVLNGQPLFTPATRVLINCRGTATTLRTFWLEGRGYDFRSCD